MFGKLIRLIFVPKATRSKLESQARTGHSQVGDGAPAGQPQAAVGREQILNEAMSIYRKQQREVYDNLDEGTRTQIEEDAAQAFGDVLKPKG